MLRLSNVLLQFLQSSDVQSEFLWNWCKQGDDIKWYHDLIFCNLLFLFSGQTCCSLLNMSHSKEGIRWKPNVSQWIHFKLVRWYSWWDMVLYQVWLRPISTQDIEFLHLSVILVYILLYHSVNALSKLCPILTFLVSYITLLVSNYQNYKYNQFW